MRHTLLHTLFEYLMEVLIAAIIVCLAVGFIYLIRYFYPLDLVLTVGYIAFEMYYSSREKGWEE